MKEEVQQIQIAIITRDDDAGKLPTQRYLAINLNRELLQSLHYQLLFRPPASSTGGKSLNTKNKTIINHYLNQYHVLSITTMSFEVGGGCRFQLSSHHLPWSFLPSCDFEPAVCYLPTHGTLSSTRSTTA